MHIVACLWTALGIVCYGFMVVRGLLLPQLLGCVFPLCFGYFRLLWNHFGHDTAKNDSGSCFSPVKSLIVGLLHARSGLSLDCIGAVNEGLMCLINLVGWEPHR